MPKLTTEQVRGEFPVLATTTFLDCAYKGPYSRRSVAAMREFIERRHTGILPDGRGDGRPERIEGTRANVAKLLGVTPQEIWFPQSTNDALSKVANMLLRPGDEILVGGLDHPSNYAIWAHLANRGIRVTVVPHREGHMEVGDLEAAVGPRTRAIGMCLVNTYNGYRQDIDSLGDLARRRGLFLLLDGIQGVGHLDIDLSGGNVTALSAGVFKWLCSPEGTGVCYLNREALVDTLPDTVYYFGVESAVGEGWGGLIDRVLQYGSDHDGPRELPGDAITYLGDARRMEASATMLSLAGLDAMVGLLSDFGGMAVVEQRVLGLASHLRVSLAEHGHTVLSDPDPATFSGITAVQVADSAEAAAFLQERGIWVLGLMSSHSGAQAVRVCTHFFNNDDDIAAFVEALDEYRNSRA